jgi:predicted HicB family RNase H-like nuclease
MARPRTFTEKRISTAVRIPESLHDRLQEAAEERDVSINHMVVRAITLYLDNHLKPLP